jgi:hypothetical protein
MDNQEIRATHKDINNKNDNAKAKIAHEFYHYDIVVEFPQSGE